MSFLLSILRSRVPVVRAAVVLSAAALATVVLATVVFATVANATEIRCPLQNQTSATLGPGNGEDLVVTQGTCTVGAGTYHYGNVNVFAGGELAFDDARIDFWATSILVENEGSLIAGSPAQPIGTAAGSVLTFHLYGPRPGTQTEGISCKTGPTCGVPAQFWTDSPTQKIGSGFQPAAARALRRQFAVGLLR